MMRNKRAWLRIVEAFVAIMIIVGILLVALSRQSSGIDSEEEISKMQKFILEQVGRNDSLRSEILDWTENCEGDGTLEAQIIEECNVINNKTVDSVLNFTSSVILYQLGYSMKICNVTDVCGLYVTHEKDIYAQELIVSSSLIEYNPKKLKLFVWEK